MTVKIACAASFADDRPHAAAEIARATQVDYLLFASASDTQLGMVAVEATRNASVGYVHQFLAVLRLVSPAIFLQPQLHLITSAGGLDARGCAGASARILADNCCAEMPVAAVYGDNLMDRLEELILEGCPLNEATTGERFRDLAVSPVFATAWLGADGLVDALEEGAKLVITGSASIPVMAAAAAIHSHRWSGAVFDRVATAALMGRMLQARSAAATAVTFPPHGAVPLAEPASLIAEIDAQGRSQLFALGGPGQFDANLLLADARQPLATPDVQVDSRGAVVEVMDDRGIITIRNVAGTPPKNLYDVTLGLWDGFEVTALLFWDNCGLGAANDERSSAMEVVEVLGHRMAARGTKWSELTCKPLGEGVAAVRGCFQKEQAAERFASEVSWLKGLVETKSKFTWLSRPHVRPYIRLWHTQVPKELIETTVDCRPAREWM